MAWYLLTWRRPTRLELPQEDITPFGLISLTNFGGSLLEPRKAPKERLVGLVLPLDVPASSPTVLAQSV